MIKNIIEGSRNIGLFWTILAGLISVVWTIVWALEFINRTAGIITGDMRHRTYVEFPPWSIAIPIIIKIIILAAFLQIDAFGQIVAWSRICRIVYDTLPIISQTINLAYIAKLDTSNILYMQYRYDLRQFAHITFNTFNMDWVVLGYGCVIFIVIRLCFGDYVDNLIHKLTCITCWKAQLNRCRHHLSRTCTHH